MNIHIFILLVFCALPVLNAASVPPWRLAELRERIRLEQPSKPVCELVLEPQLENSGGFAVIAEQKQDFQPLPLKRSGNVLRFECPKDTTSLWLYFNGQAPEPSAFEPKDNLFDGVLSNSGGTLTISGTTEFSFERPVPPDTAGYPVHLEFTFRSDSPLPFLASLELRPLDENGKELPSAAVDPRWLSMVTVPGKLIAMKQSGFLDVRAKKLRGTLKLKNCLNAFDTNGKPLSKEASPTPVLQILRLELRAAERIPVSGSNPLLFAEGVSGDALKLDGKTGFFFNALPPCVWSERRQVTDPLEYHWPDGAGTVEFFFRPDWQNDQETTLFEAFQHTRKTIFQLACHPARKQLVLKHKDFAEAMQTKTVPAHLESGKWYHIAVCWDNKERYIFLNGEAILREDSANFVYADLAASKTPDRLMPNEICLGIPAELLYRPNQKYNPASGLVDNLRISRELRYRQNFTPPRTLANDATTCALFNFDRAFDGIHDSGDGLVQSSLFSPTPRLPETYTVEQHDGSTRTIRRVPTTIPRENNPDQILGRQNYPDLATAGDFAVSRIPVRTDFSLKSGDKQTIDCPENIVMDFVEIRCPANSAPLRNPVILTEDEPDSRSFGGIVRNWNLPNLPERARVLKLFQYAISKTDYFIFHPAEFYPDSLRQLRPNYEPLSLLNVYSGDQCGPLNFMTLNLFVQAGGLPANMISGNEHTYEQVFYDGSWHVYDLSAQTFFPSRNKIDAASQEELENDPWLVAIRGASPSHFYRRGFRGESWTPSSSREEFGISLRPGEAFRYHPYNNGMHNNLQSEWGGKNLTAMAREVTGELRSDRKTWQADRTPPEFSTGVLTANWKQGDSASIFTKNEKDSFCYRIATPYPVAGLHAATVPAFPIEYSIDNGRTWAAPNDLLSLGRHGMLIRVKAPLSELQSFECKTYVMMSTRALTGMLKPGKNQIQFLADGSGNAEITLQYRKNAEPIHLSGGVEFGMRKGCEKRFFLLDPAQALEIPVTGIGQQTEIQCSNGLTGTLRNGVLTIRAQQYEKPSFQSVTIRDGSREQRATVLVCRNARLLTAEQAILNGQAALDKNCLKFKTTADSFRFDLPEPLNGKFAFLTLARNPIPQMYKEMPLLTYRHPNGKSYPLIRRRNLSTEFYKAEYGPVFRWAFPQAGTYAYMYLDLIPLSDTESLTINVNDPQAEFAALLLLPAENREEIYNLVKYFICFNYLPGLIH